MKKPILLISVCASSVLWAQSTLPPFVSEVQAVRATGPITIDAVLNESVWQGKAITQFYQMDPNQGEAGTEKTEAWIAYDDEALYIAADMRDSHPDSIAARLTRRDEEQMFGLSDEFDVYLDPYHDHTTGFFFCVTAPGSVRDGVLDNDDRFDQSWDGVWESKTRITDQGWTTEIRIPLSQLRFKGQNIHEWGINLERDIIRKGELSFLVYAPRGESGFVSRFAHLKGIEGIPSPSRLELLPYTTAKAEYLNHLPSDPFNKGSKYSPGFGLDVKYGLSSNLTFDGTVNPDFGQVEVDPAVVNLTDIETFYPEKRPFFIEGINIFRFGLGGTNRNTNFNWSNPTLFYSRRIGRAPQGTLPQYDYADAPPGTHILSAGKISGKIDDWSVGTLHAVTKREYADIEFNGSHSDVEVEPLTYYGVARTQKVFGRGNQGIGILSTFVDRSFDDERLKDQLNRNSFVAGIDGWAFLDDERTYVLTGWGSLSRVSGNTNRMISLQRNSTHYFQRPDAAHLSVDSNATSMTGYAARISLNKQRGAVALNAAVGIVDPKYETNDLGYLSRTDVINAHLALGYRWLEPTSLYRQMTLSGAAFSNWDFEGNQTAKGIWSDAAITLSSYNSIEIVSTYSVQSMNNRLTRGGPLTLSPSSLSTALTLATDNRKWWVVSANAQVVRGTAEHTSWYSVDLQLKLSSNLSMNICPEYQTTRMKAQWVGSYEDQTATDTYGKRYVFAALAQEVFQTNIRVNWILTPTLSIQFYVQPLITSGAFSEYKSLSRTRSFDFAEYGRNGSTISEVGNPDASKNYEFDADGDGASPKYIIANPDFNIRSLRANAVLRWEFTPGSAIFFVWTQNRADYESIGDFRFRHSLTRLWSASPDNIFMTKISYWFDV